MIAIIMRVLANVVLVTRTGGDGVEDGSSPQATMLVLVVVDAHRQEALRFMPTTLQRNLRDL